MFAPLWAVQSYSQGFISPKSQKAEPQVGSSFPSVVPALPCPLTKERAEGGSNSSPFPNT